MTAPALPLPAMPSAPAPAAVATSLGTYRVVDLLVSHGELTLARCHDPEGRPVLVRTPRAERPSVACLRQLGHEGKLAGEIDPAWGVRPLALDRVDVGSGGRSLLVLADPGGEPLARRLGAPLA